MKKAVIAVIALAAASGISIGAFMAVRSNSRKETEKKHEEKKNNILFTMNADDISHIQIKADGESYTVDYSDNTWFMTESSEEYFPLNQTTMTGICTYIASLTASGNFGELNDDSRAKYGLTDPYEITFSDGSETATLYIGDESPTGDYYYVYTDTKKMVYTIPSSTALYLRNERLDLIDDSFINAGSQDLRSIEVIKNGKTVYQLNYSEETGSWNFGGKYSMLRLNQARPSSISALLTKLTAESILPQTPDDAVKYGFDKPYAELNITDVNGEKFHRVISRYGGDADTYYHVYLDELKLAETYFTGDFDFLDYSVLDMTVQTFEGTSLYNVTEYEVSCDALSEKFTVDPENDKVECRGTVIDINNAELLSFYRAFFNTLAYIEICDIDVFAAPELKDPVFSAEFTKLSGEKTTIDLTASDRDGIAYIFYDGEYTGCLAQTDFIDGDDSMIAAYEILCRHSGLEPMNK